jgi:hypothetical protein
MMRGAAADGLGLQRERAADDDAIAGGEAGEDLHVGAVAGSERDGLRFEATLFAGRGEDDRRLIQLLHGSARDEDARG